MQVTANASFWGSNLIRKRDEGAGKVAEEQGYVGREMVNNRTL